MLLAPSFPFTPAGCFGALVHRMLDWLSLRVRRADCGYQPALSPEVRAQTVALHDRFALAGRMFSRLADLACAGKLRSYPDRVVSRPRDAGVAASVPVAGAPSVGCVREARRPGWMLAFVPADFTRQMGCLLQLPDIVSLIQTAPPVARLMRPLCRGLGVVPPPGVFPPLKRRAPVSERRLRPDAPTSPPDAVADAAADASGGSHRARRVTLADIGVQRHPRPWGGPAGSGVTPRGDGWASRRGGVRRNLG